MPAPGQGAELHAASSRWLNTPGDQPLSLAQLKGKVVLIDFWTYSCINCQRSLPHVESWYNEYKKDGLVVVGVHTPEFAFEHVVSNVRSEAGTLGVDYPIAVDNNYGTWDAYSNQYWPAEYLIDPSGEVRAYDFGEGGYGTMESQHPPVADRQRRRPICPPRPTCLTRPRPTRSPRRPTSATPSRTRSTSWGRRSTTTSPSTTTLPHPFRSTTSPSAGRGPTVRNKRPPAPTPRSVLHFTADDVYLVLGGSGSVDVSFNGRPLSTVKVSGIPTLYTLFSGQALQTGQLDLHSPPGVQAYDFTFG